MRAVLLACLAAVLAMLEVGPAAAAHSTATLISATSGWTPGHPLRLALRITLAPGWHTYWSNPGDAGLAPDATLSVAGGVAAPVAFAFPAPRRLPTDGLMGYGYEGAVTLPFDAPVPASGHADLALALKARWLVCAAVCVPESADLALDLPWQATPSASDAAPLFAAAAAAMPRTASLDAHLAPDGTLSVAAPFITPASVHDAWFIPSDPGVIDQAAAQVPRIAPGRLSLKLHLLGAHPPHALSGVLALVDAQGAETDLAITASPGAAAPAGVAASGLPTLLGLALLGGLVLNLMPCVFPILAMKALAIGRHGRGEAVALRRSALLYTAGVVGSFVALGLAMVGLRALGHLSGWGFQFQSPRFVGAMGWLLFAVGLNLIGALEVGGRFAGAGQSLVARGGAFGDVMTGVLAVVVATPCTAPFMSVAVAAALSGPVPAAFGIFACLGLGLASPYLLLGLIPGASRLMPRPGAWMIRLRQLLAFPMFGAAAWLAWVLSIEAGPHGVLAFVAGLVLIGFAAWLAGTLAPTLATLSSRRLATIGSVVSIALALTLLVDLGRAPVAGELPSGVVRYDAARLATLRAAGTPVFVDMSAAWCVSCLINERVALDADDVRDRFARDGIVQMRGDWSNQDRSITAFLRRFGHEGVPLYVYFPAHDAPPLVLPQILTEHTILDTIPG